MTNIQDFFFSMPGKVFLILYWHLKINLDKLLIVARRRNKHINSFEALINKLESYVYLILLKPVLIYHIFDIFQPFICF